ncbi:MAG TPA: CAP domain-containing protein [Caulobacteraceae bacterium]
MRRWGLLGLVLAVLVSAAAPAWAVGLGSVIEGLRDNGKDWLKDQAKEAGKDWIFGSGQSDTMKAILDVAHESSKSETPGQAADVCKVAVYNQVFSILSDLSYKTTFKEGASLVLTTGAKTIGLAAGGLGAAGEGGALDWMAGQYADAAKGQAEDTVFDKIAKLFSDEKKPEFEVFEQDGSCGPQGSCSYQLKALWDIVHGRYYVYIHGDCGCTPQGAGGGVKLGEWWVAYSGPMLMKVSDDKKSFTWVPGEPTIDMDADCVCSHKKLRKAYAPKKPVEEPKPPATVPLPPPPTTTEGWLKVTTTCDPCKSIAAEINAAAEELDGLADAFNQAQAEYNRAKAAIDSEGGDKELGIAPATPAQVKANQASLAAAKAKVATLGAREAALKAKLNGLWRDLKNCEKTNCGHYGMVVPGGHGVCVPVSTTGGEFASALDTAVLGEINRARADPAGYARTLKGADTSDAVAFLESQPPLPPFSDDARLDAAARREAADQGPIGGASHTGRDGSTPMSRIKDQCVIAMVVGEEISLQQKTASGVVRQLIIDATNPHHFHRADLFSSSFTLAGAACGPSAAWSEMCVVDLAAIPAEY